MHTANISIAYLIIQDILTGMCVSAQNVWMKMIYLIVFLPKIGETGEKDKPAKVAYGLRK